MTSAMGKSQLQAKQVVRFTAFPLGKDSPDRQIYAKILGFIMALEASLLIHFQRACEGF